MHERRDMPGAVEQALKVNDASFTRRSKLMLPTPQVSNQELEEIAKMGKGLGLLDDGSATPSSGALGVVRADTRDVVRYRRAHTAAHTASRRRRHPAQAQALCGSPQPKVDPLAAATRRRRRCPRISRAPRRVARRPRRRLRTAA